MMVYTDKESGKEVEPMADLPAKRKKKEIFLTEDGDNSKFTQHGLEIWELPEIDTHDAEQVQMRIGEYLGICEKNDIKPSVTGLAFAMGVDRKTLWCWANNKESKSLPEDVRNLIKKAYVFLNAQMEDYMQNGKINPASGIFLMKNLHGYVDEVKQTVEVHDPLGALTDNRKVAERYDEGVIIDADFTAKSEN